MLSDEEKKAIDELKEEINKPLEVPEDKFDTFILYNIECARTILNLIEKQSKEIEELSDKLTQKICKGVEEEILEEYRQTIISKDKEIEELKEKFSETYEYFKRDFTPNDKIKAKIEEVKDGTFDAKIVLQSLLEKEKILNRLFQKNN